MINDYKPLIKSKMKDDTWRSNYNIELIDIDEDYARTEMTVTEDMQNFLGATHGAIIFALVDQAFAAAANSKGQISVALNMSITFLAPPKVGEKLIAEAEMLNSTKRTGLYDIKVRGKANRLIAVCEGLVYRKAAYLK